MKPFLLLGFCLLASSVAWADLTIVNEIQSEGQTQEMVMKLKGKDALVKLNDQMSVLLDGATGDSTVLMHAQKKGMQIPGANLKKMAAQLAQQQAGGEGKPELTPNGKSETIGGYKTEGYTYKQGGFQAEYYLATDFPELSSVLAQLQAFQESGVNDLAGTAAQIDLSTFPGFPMKTVVQSGGKTMTSTVKSVDRQELPAETFQMPAGYEMMNLPMMPTMPQ